MAKMRMSKISSLTIWDIDDTLFTTDTNVHVIRAGKRVKSLTPAEFNVYKLRAGESLDFSEFRSAKVFADTARPIVNVFKTAKAILNRFKNIPNKKTVIVTARADLDNKKLFLDTFKKYGFNIDNVYVHRAGNLGNNPSAENKKVVIHKLIKAENYSIVRLFDDAKDNLDKFLELRTEFPATNFEAFFVNHVGSITRYTK
jgi:hypothetical protein